MSTTKSTIVEIQRLLQTRYNLFVYNTIYNSRNSKAFANLIDQQSIAITSTIVEIQRLLQTKRHLIWISVIYNSRNSKVFANYRQAKATYRRIYNSRNSKVFANANVQ